MKDTDTEKNVSAGGQATGDNGTIVLAEWGSCHVWRTRASLRTYKGRRLLDLRRCWDPGNGVLLPTKKGICLAASAENLEELEKALKLARKELEKEGAEGCHGAE